MASGKMASGRMASGLGRALLTRTHRSTPDTSPRPLPALPAPSQERCSLLDKCGGFQRAHGSSDDYCLINGMPHSYPDHADRTSTLAHHSLLSGGGYDVYMRQAYTTLDLVEMCEETTGCDCISVRLETDNSDPDWSWSMHTSSDVAAGADDKDYVIAQDDSDVVALGAFPSRGVQTTCTRESPSSASFQKAAGDTAELQCIYNCEGW